MARYPEDQIPDPGISGGGYRPDPNDVQHPLDQYWTQGYFDANGNWIATQEGGTALGGPGSGGGGQGGILPWVQRGLAGTALVGGLVRGGQNQSAEQLSPELRQLLDLQKQRMAYQNPLFEAITQMAMQRLPIQYQQPMTAPGQAPQTPDEDPATQAIRRMARPR